MKFDSTTFAKITASKEGVQIIADILSNGKLVTLQNHNFWRGKFYPSPDITPTDAKGESSVTVKMREQALGELMSMRAPLSKSAPMETPEVEKYTAPIPSFSPRAWSENAAERYYKIKAFEDGDTSDDMLVYNFARQVLQLFIDSGNQTLSHMAAKVLSTGRFTWDKGVGIKGNVFDCRIPAENRLLAGSSVWTDPDFALLTRLRSIMEDANNKHGEMAWQLEISRDRFVATFLNNTQVLNWIKLQYSIQHSVLTANVPNDIATVDYAVECLNADPTLPKIVIVAEKQNDVVLGTVSGWAQNYAVMRPVGFAGPVVHATPIEKNVLPSLGARSINRNINNVLDNLGIIITSEFDNGELREYRSQFIMNAVPVLDEFLYHYIINTGATS